MERTGQRNLTHVLICDLSHSLTLQLTSTWQPAKINQLLSELLLEITFIHSFSYRLHRRGRWKEEGKREGIEKEQGMEMGSRTTEGQGRCGEVKTEDCPRQPQFRALFHITPNIFH